MRWSLFIIPISQKGKQAQIKVQKRAPGCSKWQNRALNAESSPVVCLTISPWQFWGFWILSLSYSPVILCSVHGKERLQRIWRWEEIIKFANRSQNGFFFLIQSLLYFFHYHLVPLYPPPTPAVTTLLSMSMSPFSFLLSRSTPHPTPLAVVLLSICESVSVLLVQFVH